ncbi:ATP-binding protein [Paenibacillus typhae]|uniref:Histidine kinase-, DNA gyrase B-, and HSP90-like ATPase n=1 Tax=Paenibacillus typhae TaxID=1174501 RepID=A0A1G8ZZA3_9BACL|nr:ATP-binding protein [Paenibacillus typhae]SDK19480.1 Histidine kinase-, DNA gyrase B-, and HSP90-like ATPase [Paenibacillus typhae]
MSEKLAMTFQLNTIDHLGVKLYSSFPPVIAELVSNAYDADAKKVEVIIDYQNKEVIVSDDGHGMTRNDLNTNFLVIGRNRRIDTSNGYSRILKRKVTGRKGLGKLAVFGIAETIIISSTCENYKNTFKMNYDDIKDNSDKQVYYPEPIDDNIPVKEGNGTVITIKNLKVDAITDIATLSESLSSKFKFFDADFQVTITNSNDSQSTLVTNELYYNRIQKEFEWHFPKDFESEIKDSIYLNWLMEKGVNGHIITQKTPLQQKHKGFIIYSRKKLVQENTFFNERSNDNFHSYVTGNFTIDFIEDLNEDYISTDRRSLLWDQHKDLKLLKDNLDKLINKINNEWRKSRKEKKETAIEELIPKDFYNDVNPPERKILQNFQNQLANNIETEDEALKVVEIMNSLKNQFHFEYFKTYVSELNDAEITVENMSKISNDWEKIELHEMSKIAVGRIETINRFEKFIKENASETKYIQPFLEKFPWILDPRMTTFDREVTYSKILKEVFPDDELEESNRRIDFVCSNVNGTVHIIELKRPNIKLSLKELHQAVDYSRFLSEKRTEISDIKTFLVSDNITMAPTDKKLYDSLHQTGTLIIRTYSDMLEQAKSYHKQFIDMLDEIKKTKEGL